MKILHLMGDFRLPRDPDADGYSGIARATLELARTQVERGHEVTVASVGPAGWQSDWRGVTLLQLKHQRWARLPMLDLSVHLPYLLLTRRQHFDVLHGQMYPSLHWLRGRVRVTQFHSDPVDLPAAVLARAAASSQVQIGVSDFVTAGLHRLLPGQGDMRTVPNGVQLEAFRPGRWAKERAQQRRRWGVSDDDVVFLYAGAVVPEKGLLPLAQAYTRLRIRRPGIALAVAGDSQLWDLTMSAHPSGDHDAQVKAALHGTPGVQLLGRVAAPEMPALYAACDVLVVPSLVSETFSLSAAEAMASGLPVIVSRSGALPGLIGADPDGAGLVETSLDQAPLAGLTVPPGDVSAIETAMDRLASDAPFRQAMGCAALQRAQALSWNAAAEHFDRIYSEFASPVSLPTPSQRTPGD